MTRQLFAVTLIAVLSCACTEQARHRQGFSLPEGDENIGQMAFVAIGCHGCHTVAGTTLPTPDYTGPVSIELGGKVTRQKSYGYLVTSIINPSHKLIAGYDEDIVTYRAGGTLMPDFNRRLSVQDLIDLVAFLAPKYEVVPPPTAYLPYTY